MGFMRRAVARGAAEKIHGRYYEELDRLRRLGGSAIVASEHAADITLDFHRKAWAHARGVPITVPTPEVFKAVERTLLIGGLAGTGITIEQVDAVQAKRDRMAEMIRRHKAGEDMTDLL